MEPRLSSIFPYFIRRIFNRPGKIRKLSLERLTEPLHLNMLSLLVLLFGKFQHKVAFDLVVRQQYAFPILYAAQWAANHGIKKICIVEFGVASGAGLLNMCNIAVKAMRTTGTEIEVFGFDNGYGMPAPIDYRDRPEQWQEGDFPMDVDRLRTALPSFAHLVIGDVSKTIPAFLERLSPKAPLAFVSLDLDYYSSSKKALEVFKAPPDKYLPAVLLYLDDITDDEASPWSGEGLAVREFNQEVELRKISLFPLLRAKRIFKNPRWLDQIYLVHVFDHASRRPNLGRATHVLPNEYIGLKPEG